MQTSKSILKGLKFKVKNNTVYPNTYKITECYDKFITTIIDYNAVDFGYSEIEIVADNENDLFNLGSVINFFNDTDHTLLKNNVLNRAVDNFKKVVNIKTGLARRAANYYIYN